MFSRYLILGVAILQCLLCGVLQADDGAIDPNDIVDDPVILDNGLFELGYSPSGSYDFLPPLYWTRIPHPDSHYQEECYAGIHSEFQEGSTNWDITDPFEGESFVVLHSGGFRGVQDREVKGAAIAQQVTLTAGDLIIGAYFFGTTDYMPYNDYGQIALELAGDPNDYPDSQKSFIIKESFCDIDEINSFRSTLDISPETNGWIPFSHVVEPNQVGPYYIRCEVVDERDSVYNSYYAVDGLRICRGGKSQADLNFDCDVNLEDFSIISEAWLTFCPDIDVNDPNFPFDPNEVTIADPNIPCQLADIDNDWFVDPNDVVIFTDEWLK